MKDAVNLEIAGFIIKIELNKSKDANLYSNYKKSFLFFGKSFVTMKKIIKEDLVIEIMDKPIKTTTKIKRLNIPLIIQTRRQKKITTYYQDGVSFNLILQNALYILLSDNNGFILHSSAAEKSNKAHIFLGASGAGKSTIAKLLSNKLKILSDDLSIIRKINKKFYYFQHPLSEKNYYPRSNERFEIEAVYFLKKSQSNRIEGFVDKERVLSRFIKQLKVSDKKIIKNAMDFVFGLDNISILNFTKSEKEVINLFN